MAVASHPIGTEYGRQVCSHYSVSRQNMRTSKPPIDLHAVHRFVETGRIAMGAENRVSVASAQAIRTKCIASGSLSSLKECFTDCLCRCNEYERAKELVGLGKDKAGEQEVA
jgi:hypothetical protein